MKSKTARILLAGCIGMLLPSLIKAEAPRVSDEGMPLRVGAMAPDFSLQSVDGKVLQLSACTNGSVVLWFSNLCPGCQGAVHGIVKAYKNYSTKGVAFLAVSLLGDDTQTVREVVRKHDIPFPFLLDPKRETYLKYGGIRNPPGTCPLNPQFFIINKGRIAYATHFPGTPEAEIWESLDKLINHATNAQWEAEGK